MLCVCTDSVSEVVEGVDMVTMAVVTVRVLWALSRLLAAVPDSRALREERERDMGAIRTWMSFSSSRSCLFPELDDRFWQTDRQTDTHTHSGYVMFTLFVFVFNGGRKTDTHLYTTTSGGRQVTSCSLFLFFKIGGDTSYVMFTFLNGGGGKK